MNTLKRFVGFSLWLLLALLLARELGLEIKRFTGVEINVRIDIDTKRNSPPDDIDEDPPEVGLAAAGRGA